MYLYYTTKRTLCQVVLTYNNKSFRRYYYIIIQIHIDQLEGKVLSPYVVLTENIFLDKDEQFKDILQLEPYQISTGKYVFIISKNAKKIAFKYFEYYDDFSMKEYRLRYNIQQK